MAWTLSAVDSEFINSYSSELKLFCLTLLGAFVLQLFYRRWKKPFPPGPWGLPILGYRPFMGQFPHKKFNKLSKKYGPIMGVSIGSLNMIVLNDFDSATEVYRKEEASARPPGSFYTFTEFENVANMNGALWKEHRKFFSGYLRNLVRTDSGVENLQNIFEEQTAHLLSAISKKEMGTDVNVRELLRQGTNSTIFKILFGTTLPDDHPFIKAMSEQEDKLLKQALPTDWTMCFPKLRWLTRRILKDQQELKSSSKLVEEFISDQIESHKKNLDPEHPKDFIDHSLLRGKMVGDESVYSGSIRIWEGRDSITILPNFVAKDRPLRIDFSNGILNCNIQIILAGGTDTTRTSLEWAFMLMAKFPEVQENIFREIYKVFGRDQKPRWEDRYQLPYTMAAIMECQRWKIIAPLSALKMVQEGFSYKGYWIPKGTALTMNIWAIHNDETYWDHPEEFNPEHYLTKDGNLDLKKRFMAFSTGKRDCPGKNQAMMALFLFLVAVLQKFKVVPTSEGVSLEENLSLVAGPVKCFVRFEART